jgi:dTDP-L-rhamnose 4-epimerase
VRGKRFFIFNRGRSLVSVGVPLLPGDPASPAPPASLVSVRPARIMTPSSPATRPVRQLRRGEEPPATHRQPPTAAFDVDGKRPQVLITGGAGFIGSHLCDALLDAGWSVRVLDNLSPQVHGPAARQAGRPEYLDERVDLHRGDVRDRGAVEAALGDVDAVVHLAAAVGVGQSMYEVRHYTDVNNIGTATLLEAVAARHKQRPLRRLVVASSMSVYGEGQYEDARGIAVGDASRRLCDLKEKRWEPIDLDGRPLRPVPTGEGKCPDLSSIYALSKFDQERMTLLLGRAHDIPTTAMRFFNAYGPRQALGNPYTGVLAIFAGRLLGGTAPMVYEDGEQRRDFVHVRDVAACCWLALEADAEAIDGEVFNVASGEPRTVTQVAADLAETVGRSDLAPEVSGKYRVGDIRHCFADISKARRLLGFEPSVAWRAGLAELADWLEGQRDDDETRAAVARSQAANAELAARGLAV